MSLRRKILGAMLAVFVVGVGNRVIAQPIFENQTPTRWSESDSSSTSNFVTDTELTIQVDLNQSANATYPVIGNFQKLERSVPYFTGGSTAHYMSQAIAIDDGGIIHRAWINERGVVDPKNPDGPLAVHWTIWNIPPTVTGFAEAMATTTQLLDIGQKVTQGVNTDGFHGYTGPCPPLQTAYSLKQGYYGQTARPVDQYYFKIYALDVELDLDPTATLEELLKAIQGHVLAGGELRGEFIQKPQYSG